MSLRGGFHPSPGEFAGLLPAPNEARTVLLLGFTGGVQWPAFAGSDEAVDGGPHPLDRWSRRIIDKLADDWGGIAIYPNDVPPRPFQRFATRGEPVHRSPIGLLIHERWGLWHAYRGAVILPEILRIPEVRHGANPCTSCASRPCLSTCPVGAFTPAGYDVGACLLHVNSAAGSDCREHGCRARRACPVGADHRYDDAQMRFHMAAFIAAARRTD